jgi:hypothetical protein
VRNALEPLTPNANRRAQDNHVWPRNCTQASILQPSDPWRKCTIAKAEYQLHMHVDAAALTHYESDKVGGCASQRHEINEADAAFLRRKAGLENERVATVAANAPALLRVGRCNQPAAVTRVSEQGGEAGIRIETRPTQPIDRSISPDQSGRFAVAN